MDTIQAVAFLGAVMLFFVLSLSVLCRFSEKLARAGTPFKVRRTCENRCLIVLVFLTLLVILLWRVS